MAVLNSIAVRLAVAGMATVGMGWVGAAQALDQEAWRWNGELITVVTAPQVRMDSLYNPGNLLGGAAGLYMDSALRLNGRWKGQGWLLSAGPRLSEARSFDDARGREPLLERDAYLQHWRLERRLGPVDLYYNREDMQWGTSLLASPSNPFFTNQDRTNSLVEVATRDFLGARLHLGEQDRINLMANVGQGRDKELLRDFKPIYAVQYERVGEQSQWGGLLSWRDRRWRMGAWGHVLTGPGSLLYADTAWTQEPERLAPRLDPMWGWRLQERERPDRRYLDALAGVAVSLGSSSTLNVEYRYNGAGYTRAERRDMDAFALSNASRMLLFDPVGGGTELAKAVRPNRSPWARQTVAAYLSQALGMDTHAFALVQYDLERKDRALTLILEQALGSHVRLIFNGTVHAGGDRQSFQRYADHVLFAGLRVSF